jgi:CRISPR-associated endonuclease/helicase Cas3
VAVEPRYPGWLFTDAATGEVSAARETATGRPRSVDVEIHRVVWDTDAEPSSTPRPGGRRAALRSALRPVADGGGTALVCCTTVAEAQRTFRDLCSAYPDLAAREGGLRLLHSRFPAERRQRITAECEAAYGKPTGEARTPRQASILVATQVVEQSLDFDFDLVVSDLAPLAQLLQRVGRARRHERGVRGRPSWAQPEDRPRLVVLEPVDGGGAFSVPRTWGSVYDPGLLRRTAHLLASRTRQGIAVPGDVQSLVDAVYAEDFVVGLDAAAARELERMDAERAAEEMAENAMADLVGIPPPADIGTNLHLLSRREAGVTEDLLTTRLGADTGRVLCLYEQCAGRLTLDPDGQHPFDLGAFSMPSREQLARLMAQTVPVPGRWLPPGADGEPAPGEWEKQPLLRDLVLVRMRRGIDEAWEGRHGGHLLTLSDVGLEQVT